jgi:hypothetical protein
MIIECTIILRKLPEHGSKFAKNKGKEEKKEEEKIKIFGENAEEQRNRLPPSKIILKNRKLYLI